MLKRTANPLVGLALWISLVLAAYGGRLYWLQVVQYRQYATLSQNNRLALEPIRALRGQVYARDGKTLLVGNRAVVDLVYRGGEVRFYDKIAKLAGLGGPLPDLGGQPEKVLKANLSENAVYGVAEWAAGQPSLELRTRVERLYPTHASGNLLGYTRPADDRPEDEGYTIDDLVGAAGVERGLEHLLRGQNGLKFIEVDAGGREVGERVEREAVPGKDVVLTIDPKLQAAAERAIVAAKKDINQRLVANGLPKVKEARGAIVALDPRSGEVLALATGPKFDPNWLAKRPAPREAQRLLLDPDGMKPIWPRAIKNYEPGSTFKLLTSSAILENFGNKTFTCYPGFRFGGGYYENWTGRNVWPMDVREAIANSCNTWFYQYAASVGPTNLARAIARRAHEFGFGERTGIELPNEDRGFVAGPEGYAERGREWNDGDGLSFAIGQLMLVTPLQVARMVATVVNDGRRPELTLVRAVDGKPAAAKPTKQLSGTRWSTLKEGLRLTVTARSGSAHPYLGPDRFPVPTAGKTGSAQHGGADTVSHAWYMGYGPVDKPELVVVAFFENADHGYYSALPAVKRVMAAHWGVKLNEKDPFLRPLQEPERPALVGARP
jgi:penicillin-binding protein 2